MSDIKKVRCQNNRPHKVHGVFDKNALCGRIIGYINIKKDEFDLHRCRDCNTTWQVIKKQANKFVMGIVPEDKIKDTEELGVTIEGYTMRIS